MTSVRMCATEMDRRCGAGAASIRLAVLDGIDLVSRCQGAAAPLVSMPPATLAPVATLLANDLRAICRWWLRRVGGIATQPLFELSDLQLETPDLRVDRPCPVPLLLQEGRLPLDRRLLTRTEPFQVVDSILEGQSMLRQRVYHGATLRDFGPWYKSQAVV